MTLTIKELLHAPEFQCLTLIGGEVGLNRYLTGINIIESDDLITFCRPNELIITTGVHLDKDPRQLEDLIKHAYNQKVSGFIINIGPYIPEIPPTIIQFANDHHFPILTMEWKYRVADLLKNTIELLSSSQTIIKEENDQQLLYNLIFRYDQPRINFEKQLQQRGIAPGAELGIITCTTKDYNQSVTQFKDIIFRAFQHRYHQFLHFQHHNEFIFLINRSEVKTTNIPFSKTVEKIYEQAFDLREDSQLVIGMGNFYTKLHDIAHSYEESLTVIHLIKQHRNPFIQKHKELGAYNIIMNVPDQSIIQTFQQNMLGQLYYYDQIHNTDFVDFLKIYLEENGSANKISKRLFIHRNTVAYKINKIETLLDVDLNNTFARTNLSVAFMIEDVLTQKKH